MSTAGTLLAKASTATWHCSRQRAHSSSNEGEVKGLSWRHVVDDGVPRRETGSPQKNRRKEGEEFFWWPIFEQWLHQEMDLRC